MFDDEFGGCLDGFLVGLIDSDSESLGRGRVNVGPRAKRVLTDICP